MASNRPDHVEQPVSISTTPAQWRYFEQKPFTRDERATTTVLFGGLTFKHERLVRGALKALGYKADIIPTPTVADFQTGKEYGNYGQCNPTYFTVGSLVNHLKRLEGSGLSKGEIVDKYVYITPESPCGPCRLGMYQNEYRLATDNSGFTGFRVIGFQQKPKLNGDPNAGLEINIDFSFALVFSILMGDIVNEVAYAIRPFEVNPGETDRVVEQSIDDLEGVTSRLTFPPLEEMNDTLVSLARLFPKKRSTFEVVLKLHRWFKGETLEQLLKGLHHVAQTFNAIEIDRTRPKSIVKITGEFWAQTTEGEGNFGMFRFLEEEGAQLMVEPVATWLYYMIHGAKQDNRDLTALIDKDELEITFLDRLKAYIAQGKKEKILALVDKAYVNLYNKMRAAFFDIPHALVNQQELEDLAHRFYHSRLEGGEGHLEVAKNVYYHQHHLCHMVLSLKPFGCMPSTQSDAVQAAAQGAYGDMIFLPIETSGEGKVNALSRVQMALGEAKRKTKREFQKVLEETGLTTEDVRAYLDEHPEMKQPSYLIPHYPETVGTAANLVRHVHERMRQAVAV